VAMAEKEMKEIIMKLYKNSMDIAVIVISRI
jgi:hypothetical protein